MNLYTQLLAILRNALNEDSLELSCAQAQIIGALITVDLERARRAGESTAEAKADFLSFCALAWDAKVDGLAAREAASDAVRASDKEALH